MFCQKIENFHVNYDDLLGCKLMACLRWQWDSGILNMISVKAEITNCQIYKENCENSQTIIYYYIWKMTNQTKGEKKKVGHFSNKTFTSHPVINGVPLAQWSFTQSHYALFLSIFFYSLLLLLYVFSISFHCIL